MGYYDSEQHVNEHINTAEGYDGRELISGLRRNGRQVYARISPQTPTRRLGHHLRAEGTVQRIDAFALKKKPVALDIGVLVVYKIIRVISR